MKAVSAMKPLSVVIFQSDRECTELLVKSLHTHFRMVNVARDLEDLKRSIPQHRADAAIVDLEFAGLDDVQSLHREFPAISIVCTHRLADEQMWTSALAAGAADCCSSGDVRAIVLAATHTPHLPHSHAA
jgi:DNA-binding NarL/FixJ family response regulator